MAMSETMSEIRLPKMTRLSTSRPKRSVPSGCWPSPRSIQIGGISFWVMSPSVGLCGARYGANTAVSTSTTRITPGNQGSSRLRARMANPRVEVAIQDVHEEVADEIERAQYEDAGLHDRIIAGGDRFEDPPSEPRPREHGLGNHRAAEELHEQHDREGDDRQQGVLQAVLPQHDLLVQSLEPRALDGVRAEPFQHRGGVQGQDRRRREVAEREGGQDDVLDPAAAAGRGQ